MPYIALMIVVGDEPASLTFGEDVGQLEEHSLHDYVNTLTKNHILDDSNVAMCSHMQKDIAEFR